MEHKSKDNARTVFDAVMTAAECWPDKLFLHIPARAAKTYSDTAIDLTYSQMKQQVLELQSQYQKAGYGLGHRVALLLENRASAFVHWFALNGLGVGVVPINGEMSESEIAYFLQHSESCLGISISEKKELFEAAAALTDLTIPVILHDSLNDLPAPATPALSGEIGPKTECTLMYTSGSTGKPKGCILDNEYVIYAGRWYRDLGGLCHLEPGQERLITPLPMVHMNAMIASTMGMIMTGGCIIQLDRFHPSTWWQSVRESKATVLHYLGVMPAMLLNSPPSPEDNLSGQIKFAFGAGVNPTHHAPFEKRFGFPLIEGWAMTESGVSGCIIANREPRNVGTSCLGKPDFDRIEIKLIDEQGQEVADGEPGELLVRGTGDDPWAGFFSGYLKNEKATNETLADGWLHTGDVMRAGPDGSMYFVDRRKNIIRRSGENISALEVEAVVSKFSSVDEVVVCPVPDEIRGDEVFAAVILSPGTEANDTLAQALFKHAYDALVYYKVPGYIKFVTELPLTASGKPQRGEIKKLAASWLEQGECFNLCKLKRKHPKPQAVSQ